MQLQRNHTICVGLALAIAMLIGACSTSPYPGFSEKTAGLYYQLHVLGDGAEPAADNEYLRARVQVFSRNNELVYDSRWREPEGEKTYTPEMLDAGLLGEGLRMLVDGDSVTFLVDHSELDLDTTAAGLPDTLGQVRVEVLVTGILTREAYIKAEEYYRWVAELKRAEPQALAQCLDMAGMTKAHLLNGIYFLETDTGAGQALKTGDVVNVHYEGWLADSSKFDSTVDRNEPMEFRLGDQDQVLPGFEAGLRQMRRDGKAKFVIPSHLGFGPRGSSTGIIPPYTPLLYSVEIINVR